MILYIIILAAISFKVIMFADDKAPYRFFGGASLGITVLEGIAGIACLVAFFKESDRIVLYVVGTIVISTILYYLANKHLFYAIIQGVFGLLGGAVCLIGLGAAENRKSGSVNYSNDYSQEASQFDINGQVQSQFQQTEEWAAQSQQAQSEAADAYAQGMGFRDADDAERGGFNTGKYQQ